LHTTNVTSASLKTGRVLWQRALLQGGMLDLHSADERTRSHKTLSRCSLASKAEAAQEDPHKISVRINLCTAIAAQANTSAPKGNVESHHRTSEHPAHIKSLHKATTSTAQAGTLLQSLTAAH